MADRINININPDELEGVACMCGCTNFISILQLRNLPALRSPSGKFERIMLHIGFACVACGSFHPLRPEEPPKESNLVIFTGREN